MRFIDGRSFLPRGPGAWAKRPVEKIRGGVVHHTGGGDDVVATARYHTGPNHVASSGMPRLGYTFFINRAGDIFLANDLDDATWSQGGKGPVDLDGDGKVDGHPNRDYLAICIGGSFRSRGNPAGGEPTTAQVISLAVLVGHLAGLAQSAEIPVWLSGAVPAVVNIYGHDAFGKPACPGDTLSRLCAAIRPAAAPRGRRGALEWQQALLAAGHSPGALDGAWGPRSKGALIEFQRARGLHVSGVQDDATEDALFGA